MVHYTSQEVKYFNTESAPHSSWTDGQGEQGGFPSKNKSEIEI